VITLIVPFAAGGPTDIFARIVSLAFQKSLGQSVVVENRGGAAGNIGMTIAARAAPDGYTLLLSSTAIAVNPALFKNLGYDPIKDFAPVSELVNAPNVIVVRANSGIDTLADSDRAREGGAGHVQLREPRRGHQVASHRRAAQAARRHRHGARAVSRRLARRRWRCWRERCRSARSPWPPRRRSSRTASSRRSR
jgi:tripartite-type tricarboxylate transporter receptor subunit TctC